MIIPKTGSRRRLNSDAAFLLLLHKVGGCGAVVHLTGFVDFTGELKDTLGGGGFTRIDVRKDADISIEG